MEDKLITIIRASRLKVSKATASADTLQSKISAVSHLKLFVRVHMVIFLRPSDLEEQYIRTTMVRTLEKMIVHL